MSGFSTSLTAVKFVSLHSSIHTFLSRLSAKRFLGYTVTNSTIQSFYNLPMHGFVHFNSSSYHNLDLVIRRTAIICVDSKWHGKVTLFPIKLITSCHVCLGQSHSWPFGIPLCRRSGAALILYHAALDHIASTDFELWRQNFSFSSTPCSVHTRRQVCTT